MQTSSQTACNSMPIPAEDKVQNSRVDGVTYQVVTVASILLLLGSLWLF